MKKILLIFILSLSLNAFAQDKGRYERIKALKIAFITERLDLSETEAQKFWPIYNAFEAENQKLRNLSVSIRKNVNTETISEKNAKEVLQNVIKIAQQKQELHAKFITDLLKALPAKKIILLNRVEGDFKDRMMEQFKKRRGGNRKNIP